MDSADEAVHAHGGRHIRSDRRAPGSGRRPSRAARRALAALVALATVVAGTTSPSPAAAYPDRPGTVGIDGACEGEMLRLHNQARAAAGRPALREDPAIDQIARGWAIQMATSGSLAHNPRHATDIRARVPSWTSIGENVGYAPTPAGLHQAFMNSAGHRNNIVSGGYQRVAIGCARDRHGRAWVAVNFVGASTSIPDRRPAPFLSAGDASGRLRYWLLGAGPAAAQIESDAARLLTGQTNVTGLAVTLATSSSHGGVGQVTRLYYSTFLRHPDTGGLRHWIRARMGGTSLQSIARQFVNSPEFQARYGSLDDGAFVDLVYQNVLGRSPDASGRAYWVDQLRRGVARAVVLIGFSESPEHQRSRFEDVTTSWAFVQMLDRVPTSSERATWSGRLRSGSTTTTLITSLAQSQAFAARAAHPAY